ncbi:D-glycerate dehydrogenase [Caulobacter sp. S45]|uniref:2-hydroxyacid dehydrogenase n=1 Tax=Caulobacter sp. S45 TaxID=1641861 RepID=UPI001575325E|nr:D-glycerate dehydrogenase [Caulobacter sp. S45]
MPDRKLKVVVTRKLPAAVEARMRELFDVELNADDRAMSADALAAAVARADVLAPTVTDRIDAGVLAQAGPQLKLIANFGAGFEHIDVASANARGIIVTNTPGVLTEDTADMAMALILAVQRRVVEGAKALEAGRFEGWTPTWMMGRRLRGKSLGVIGMGRIGQALARRAKAFGLSIHYHNRRPIPGHIAEALEATHWESLDQMLARMDVVSLNCPHTPGTYHLLSARRLKLMPPHAILINTARGGVVDEAALAARLAEGSLAGAGLDVYENEPRVDPRLLKMPNVVLLPHLGSATIEGRAEMGDKVIINIKAFQDGHRPPDRVLPSML